MNILLFLILTAICLQQIPFEQWVSDENKQKIRTIALIGLILIGAFFVFVR